MLAAAIGPNPSDPSVVMTYFIEAGDEEVYVVDGSTHSVVARIPVRPQGFLGSTLMREVVATADGETLILSGIDGPPHLAFVDARQRQLAERLSMPAGAFPGALALSPDGAFLYVATVHGTSAFQAGKGTVQIVDLQTRKIAGEIPLPDSPSSFNDYRDIAVSADGGLVFVLSRPANGMHILDLTSGTVSTTLRLFGGPRRLAVHPDGTRVYTHPTTNPQTGDWGLGVVDVATATLAAHVALPQRSQLNVVDVAITPHSGGLVLVSAVDLPVVWHIDTFSNTIVDQTDTGEGATHLFIA